MAEQTERERCAKLFDWWIEHGQYDADTQPGDIAAAIANGTTVEELIAVALPKRCQR